MKQIGIVLVSIVIVAFSAILSGVLVWWLWPHSIMVIFPTVPALTLWQSIALTWISSILVKTSLNTKN